MATRAMAPRLAAERRFFFWMAAAILATIFAGFAPSFYLRGLVPSYAPYLPMTWLVLFHGLLFSAYHLHVPWRIPASLLDMFLVVYPTKRYRSAWIGIAVHSAQTVVLGLIVLTVVI